MSLEGAAADRGRQGGGRGGSHHRVRCFAWDIDVRTTRSEGGHAVERAQLAVDVNEESWLEDRRG